MKYPSEILVDAGLLVAYYSSRDDFHIQVCQFFEECTSNLITTAGCITETMYLLNSDWKVQNEFLNDLYKGIYNCECLTQEDFHRIAELNEQYSDLPGEFADLSLVAISERLNISAIATLDRDFDVYRRYRNQPFQRVFWPIRS
jgi:predicted nucleic acid-binding protein